MIDGNRIEDESEWLIFQHRLTGKRTEVWSVLSKSDNTNLGTIKWHNHWRHYCFFPTTLDEIVLSDRCLLDIGNFVKKMNKAHTLMRLMKK